jgi:hypothetical protein
MGVAGILGLVVVDQVAVWWTHRITISRETTRLTSPLVQGYPDYRGALNAKMAEGVTPENNAAVLLVQVVGVPQSSGIFGDSQPPTPEYVAALCERLRIRALGEPTFTTYDQWMTRKQVKTDVNEKGMPDNAEIPDEELSKLKTAPWATREHQDAASWLEEMKPALNVVEEACDRPRFYFPLLTENGQSGGEAGMIDPGRTFDRGIRPVAMALAARSMRRLDAGDMAGFRQDVATLLKLSRLTDQQPNLISHLMAMAIDALATRCLDAAAAVQTFSAEEAKACRQLLAETPPLPSCAQALDVGERYRSLEMLCVLNRGGVRVNGNFAFLYFYPVSFNQLLRDTNRYYDRTVAACDLPTFEEQWQALEATTQELDTRTRKAGFLDPGAKIIEIVVPSLGKAQMLNVRAWVERDLALTALALREAKAQRGGAFPEKLEDLKAVGLTAPVDRFSGQALMYARKGDGFVLYSVGDDRQDDHGTSQTEMRTPGPRGFDIVVRAER